MYESDTDRAIADVLDELIALRPDCRTIGQLEKVLEQTQKELNAANKAANEAEAQFRKAKEWNALCELELNNLRSIAEDQDQELSALRIMLLELCEKMEAGLSGPEETKRARGLLDAIKANQEKKS